MRSKGVHGLDNLETPPYIIEAVQDFHAIELDPCASCSSIKTIPAVSFYTEESDGLSAPWGDKFVYLNPPHSNIECWVEKLASHPSGGIALLPVRPTAAWFQNLVIGRATGVCFLKERVKFLSRPRRTPVDFCLVWYVGQGTPLAHRYYFATLFTVLGGAVIL